MRHVGVRLAIIAILVLGGCGLLAHIAPHAVVADGASLSVDPGSGHAATVWRVVLAGFGGNETVDLAFTAPDGSTAQVGSDPTFSASTQDDGTAVFAFSPAQWLSPLLAGTWTVTATGQQSGMVVAAVVALGS